MTLNTSEESSFNFDEIIVIRDSQDWIWNLISNNLSTMRLNHIRVHSDTNIRKNWDRFKGAKKIIIFWENEGRIGGPIIEEIYDIDTNAFLNDAIIVVTLEPTRDDIVYFNELILNRIVILSNRSSDRQKIERELKIHMKSSPTKNRIEYAWQKILKSIHILNQPVNPNHLNQLKSAVSKLRFEIDRKPTPYFYDATGSIAFFQGNLEEAEISWHEALTLNPNYYRSYNKLIDYYQKTHQYEKSLSLMSKMQALNKNNIGRLVKIGQIYSHLNQYEKAEHYFLSALSKDKYCCGALNGLAAIRFHQGNLNESRQLLSQSSLSSEMASDLNKQGIKLVKEERYEDALEHYTKAQYVIPHQDKGPLLFYNIGLCYSKWGKEDLAAQFLRLALVKSPDYKKAQSLLNRINKPISNA